MEKRVTNKMLLKKVEVIGDKLENLADATMPDMNSINEKEDEGINFLMIEFQEISNAWKHIDSRTESSIRLFFTASTILLSAITISITQLKELNIVFPIVIVSMILLCLGATLIMRRIIAAFLLKEEYFKAIKLIRRYFMERNTSIKDYLLLPTLKKSEISIDGIKKDLTERANRNIVKTFQLMISITSGLTAIVIVYQVIQKINVELFIIIGLIFFTIALILLEVQKRRLVNQKVNRVYKRAINETKMNAEGNNV